jgi:hypothetical protein
MRRRLRDDHGVVTIMVVLAMPILLGFAALTFDGARGVLAQEHAQNSADAAAMGKAFDCAQGNTTTVLTGYQQSGAVLDTPAPVCDMANAQTTVHMKETVTYSFPMPGAGASGTAHRQATAKWGVLSASSTLPVTISACEWSQALLDGSTDIVIYLDDAKPQTGCSSLPGGFSLLRDDVCSLSSVAGGPLPPGDVAWYQGKPGADAKKAVPCITPLPKSVLVPLYDSAWCNVNNCNGNDLYPIKGYAEFQIDGYSFNGSSFDGTLGKDCPDTSRGKYCMQGDFIRYVTGVGTVIPGGTDYGATVVYLAS